MKKSSVCLSVLCAVVLAMARAGAADSTATNRWETTAAAGLTLTRGNSETLLGSLTLNSTRKWPRDEVFLGAAGAYGENTVEKTIVTPAGTVTKDDTQKTTESISAFGQYNHLFTEKLYAGPRIDFLHDAIADLDYRVTISPVVGYYVIKEANTRLSFEAGPSGVFERQGDEDNQYAALRLAERFEHKFSDTAKVWQSLEYIPQVDRFHNYLIIAEIGAEAGLTKKLSLRGVLQDIYDNEPAAGRKNNDIKLITGLAYRF